MDLSVGPLEQLGVFALTALADAEEEVTFIVEYNPAAEVDAAGLDVMFRLRLIDRLLVNERATAEFSPDDPGEGHVLALVILLRIGVGEINPAVLRKLGMQDDVKESRLTGGVVTV